MRRVAAAATWAVLAAGCEQPRTELIARVDSELAWGARQTVQAVTLTVRRGGPTGALRSARTTALGTESDRQPLPLTVGILPGDDLDTPVWIEALGCSGPNGCDPATAVVAQRAVVRFTRGRTEEVPLLLASACVGATCGSDERCGEGGRCEPATRAMVRPFDGIDAGMVTDVTITDRVAMDVADATGGDVALTDLGHDTPQLDMAASDATTGCESLELFCGGRCVAVLFSTDHCGRCDRPCPAPGPHAITRCEGGRCDTVCEAGWADCDGVASTGCEFDARTDHEHCGACARACDAEHECVGGSCVRCPSTAARYCASSGCRDLPSDPFHCNACGLQCAGGVCRSGVCADVTCPTGSRLVPTGAPLLGGRGETDRWPVRRVYITGFCMGETEITAGDYRACMAAGACSRTMSPDTLCSFASTPSGTGNDMVAANCLRWDQARVYCAWRGGRLPTEAEWEYAARGTDGRIYPWGDSHPTASDSPQRLCWATARPTQPNPCQVGAFPLGDSPFGLHDMAGGVAEWVSDWHEPTRAMYSDAVNPIGPATGVQRGVRGGARSDDADPQAATSRRRFDVDNSYTTIGARCAWATIPR